MGNKVTGSCLRVDDLEESLQLRVVHPSLIPHQNSQGLSLANLLCYPWPAAQGRLPVSLGILAISQGERVRLPQIYFQQLARVHV